MITLADPLPDDLETAHQLIRELIKALAQQVHLNEKLQHQLEQLLRRRYGPKAERIDPAQLLLFAREILAQAEPAPAPTPEPDTAPTPRAPQKEGHGRKPLPASLPRQTVLHDVPLEQRICPDCGTERTWIGQDVREQLEYIPASLIVLEHIRPKYACRACAAHVVIADRLPEPIDEGLPGLGSLAYVVASKYADHLPLYRLEGIFRRSDVELSRATMCDWMAVAAELLEPIIKRMLGLILTSKVVQNDDTTVPVQDHSGKGIKTGRLWVSIGDHDHPYTVYTYTPDRSAAGPRAIFQGFQGYLQADAYSAYDGLYTSGEIVEVFKAKCGLREPPSGRARCSGNLRTGPSRPRPMGPPASGSGFARRFTVSIIRDVSAPPRPSRRFTARTIHS
jgi:transposase